MKDAATTEKRTQLCKKFLLEEGLLESPYLEAAASYISGEKEEEQLKVCAHRMKLLYGHIAKRHGREAPEKISCMAAALLAVSGIKVPEYMQRTARMEDLLRNWIAGETIMKEAEDMILLFHVDDIALCEKSIALKKQFEKQGCFTGSGDGFLLGLLSISKESPERIAAEISCSGQETKDAAFAYLENTFSKKDEILSQVALRTIKGSFSGIINFLKMCLCYAAEV